MLSVIGIIVVLGSVVGGYLYEGGHMEVLIQPAEIIIIVGAGVGSLIVSCSPKLLKAILGQLVGIVKGGGPSKDDYMELLNLLFELTKTAKANPLSIEAHVDAPENSDIFRKYPVVLNNHHAIDFICDTLKVQLSGSMSPYDLEDLMDADITSAHDEEFKAPMIVGKMGDALPGLGIVAAVMGVVITMGHLTEGKQSIGEHVAAALVGTFMGVLGSYGFVQPIATKIEFNINAEGKFLSVIKSCLLAYAKNCGPKVCVEFARRSIPPETRPTFQEVDAATSSGGAASKKAA